MSEQSTKRHPNADVIIAWAEGAALQYKRKDIPWTDYIPFPKDTPEFNATEMQWRVKPETKIGWVAIGYSSVTDAVYENTKKAAITAFKLRFDYTPMACIQITYTEGEGL